MRVLSFILAFMVIVLSIQQPVCAMSASAGECCSVDGCTTGQREESKDHHEKECSSICNPFQSCGCCAFSVVVPQPISFVPTIHTEMPRIQWGAFVTGIAEEPVSGFWQPPRLA